jgi:hypothetical protein
MQRHLIPIFSLWAAGAAHAVVLQLDYSLDSTNFFGTNPAAKTALEAAATDISAAILPSLGAIPTDTFTGTNLLTTATFDWRLNFENPSTGAPVTLPTFTRPADSIVIYVGARPLLGSALGEGGPGGAGVTLSGSSILPLQWQGAVAAAESASNDVMPRDGGPIIGRLRGSSTVGIETANYDVSYGAILGNLWFDSDTNDDGAADSNTLLNAFWHFDSTTSVAPGKNDFYSVALHELLHSVGFGSSETWNNLVSGSTWLGASAIALHGGTGTNLISGDGAHAASGSMSRRLFDLVPQEAVMDPSLTVGTRKYLTELDMAFLRDIGYVTVVPEPSIAALMTSAGLLLWRRRIAVV